MFSAETVVVQQNSRVTPKTVVLNWTKQPPLVSRPDGAARDSLPRPCQHLQQRHHQHSQGESKPQNVGTCYIMKYMNINVPPSQDFIEAKELKS